MTCRVAVFEGMKYSILQSGTVNVLLSDSINHKNVASGTSGPLSGGSDWGVFLHVPNGNYAYDLTVHDGARIYSPCVLECVFAASNCDIDVVLFKLPPAVYQTASVPGSRQAIIPYIVAQQWHAMEKAAVRKLVGAYEYSRLARNPLLAGMADDWGNMLYNCGINPKLLD
jgi:hypothetical protein